MTQAYRNIGTKITVVQNGQRKGLFTKKEVGVVMQFFTLSLVVRFIVRLLITLYDLLYAGRPHDELMGSYFDPLHHTYLSMYLLFALSYIALQLLRGQWEWRHWPFVSHKNAECCEYSVFRYDDKWSGLVFADCSCNVLGLP